MRGGNALGRFDAEYETHSIWDGISRELARPVGQDVKWYRYSDSESTVHPVYDVGSPTGGRVFRDPITFPVTNAYVTQGQQFDNDRGMYMVDIMRLFINYEDVMREFPSLLTAPDEFIKDRIIFRGQAYVPNRVNPRGQVAYDYMTLTIDLIQVKPEESYNDVYVERNFVLATPPGAPQNLVVTHGNQQLTVTYDPPLFDNGSDITSYVVEYNDGSGWVVVP